MADGRHEEPYVSPARWNEEFRMAGFSATDAVYDDEFPYQINANMISTAVGPQCIASNITLLYQSEFDDARVHEIEAFFRAKGFQVEKSSLNDSPPTDGFVISLLDLTGPFFNKITTEALAKFQAYMSGLKETGLLWLTKASQIDCKDPDYALVLGMARTLRSELSLDFFTFEVENFDESSWQALLEVYEKIQQRTKDDELNPDYEYAFTDGKVMTGRYHWLSVDEELQDTQKLGMPVRLEIGKYGLLDSLSWVPIEHQPLVGDQVEVDIRCVGLNFKVRNHV